MKSEPMTQWYSDRKPQSRLGIFGLLTESFKTIIRNGKLMLPVLVLVFLLFSHLEFAQIYLLEPVSKDFALQLVKHPKLLQDIGTNKHRSDYSGALNDIREVLLVKLFILTLSSIISLVFLVATVASSSEAYTAKGDQNLTEMIMKIKRSWKKAIVTSFYIIILTIGFIFVCLFCIGMVSIFAVGSWAYKSYGVIFWLIGVLWVYFSALWMMSLVVSVLEEVGGLDAIVRGRELMKGGKVKASLLMALFYVAHLLVFLMTSAIISPTLEKWSRMVITIVLTNGLLCGLQLFVFVVFTVFYHEQKEGCDEEAAKSLYLPVVNGEV